MTDKHKPKKKEPVIREGQENSSILSDKHGAKDLPIPPEKKMDIRYKSQEEFVEKMGSRKDDDD